MSQRAQDSEAVEVVAISHESGIERPRISAHTPEELIDLVLESADPGAVIVAIDAAFGIPESASEIDTDRFIALASVLVTHGVRAFVTSRPQIVRRVLAMNSAIEAGTIEVLG